MLSRTRSISFLFTAALSFLAVLPVSAQSDVTAVTIADGLSYPWAVAPLPSGSFLVTERDGVLKYIDGTGKQSVVPGVPQVFAQGQGGLLDIALSPNFENDNLVFITFSQGSPEGAGTSLFKAQLKNTGASSYELIDGEVIFVGNNRAFGGRHFGSRLAFASDGTLFMTIGDRGEDIQAQNPGDHSGSVLRLTSEGSPASGNPFLDRQSHKPEIWSIGHRNPQSAAVHPETGVLWTVEHGARGGDEINIPEAGKNYGWPIISYGRHYTGGKIGEGTEKSGMEQPIHYWDPSIAPSGMAFVNSEKYPEWSGNLLVGALRGRHILRLELKGSDIVAEEKVLQDLGERIRDVRQASDGFIYILTDSDDGRLIRLDPR